MDFFYLLNFNAYIREKAVPCSSVRELFTLLTNGISLYQSCGKLVDKPIRKREVYHLCAGGIQRKNRPLNN
jgi:hypothetical protein